MAELVEGHIRTHVLDPRRKPTGAQRSAADEMVDIVRAYLSSEFFVAASAIARS
jgi:hypothetical protein